MSQESLHQLRTWIAESGLDAFLVSQAQNRSYLSGWLSDDTESHSSLLIGQQEQLLLTNSLFAEVAEKEAVGWQVIIPEGREYAAAVVKLANKYHWEKIGFEADALSYADYEKLR